MPNIAQLNEIFSWFQTNDKPTQTQFENTFFSFRHKNNKIVESDLHQDVIDLLYNIGSNFYTTNGQLTGNRTVDGDSNNLIYEAISQFVIKVFTSFSLSNAAGEKIIQYLTDGKSLTIGDVNSINNGTKLQVLDNEQIVIVRALLGFCLRNANGLLAHLKATNLTDYQNYEFPNNSGTIALTSDLTSKADLVNGLVPSNQLPSFVDDVLEFAGYSNFPTTGETGKIYIAISPSNKQYRWTGTSYIQITNGLIGSTTDVPEGSNKYFTEAKVLASILAGFNSSTGTITASDSVLSAIQKLNGNLSLKIKDVGEQSFNGAMTITATTAPSGGTAHYYQWTQTGRLVRMSLYLKWGTAGSGMTALLIDLPNDMPVPADITIANNANNVLLYPCNAHGYNTLTGVGNTMWCFIVRGDGTTRQQRIQINHAAQSNYCYQLFLQYFTNN